MASFTKPTSTVILLDLPPKTFVGINLVSFNSSPNFHGLTNVPSGLHCIYTGTDATLSLRHCHWLAIGAESSESQVHVLRWLHDIESLELLRPTSTAAQAAIRSIPSLRGSRLVDYNTLQNASSDLQAKQSSTIPQTTSVTNAETWPQLAKHITPDTLARILVSADINASQEWILSSISSGPSDTESIPGLSTEEAAKVLNDNQASTLNFVDINLKQTWPSNSVGRDRTEKARDRSWYLGHLIDSLITIQSSQCRDGNAIGRQAGAKQLLAELQFCFLMVLTLANYSCLEQWKRILSVLLTCKVALGDVEGFFLEVLEVLRVQLERVDDVDGGLFEMGDETGSAWLRALLRTFRGNVDEVFGDSGGEAGELSVKLGQLESWLRETYGWEEEGSVLRRGMVDLEDGERVEVQMDGLDEEEETGEYAPVIVEM